MLLGGVLGAVEVGQLNYKSSPLNAKMLSGVYAGVFFGGFGDSL